MRKSLLTEGTEKLNGLQILEMLSFARQPDGDIQLLAMILIPKFGSLAAILPALVKRLADQHGPSNASTSALKLEEVASLHLAHSDINDCPSD